MTIIAAVQCVDGNVIMADGRVLSAYTILYDDVCKVSLCGNILLAGAGSDEAVQYVERQVQKIKESGQDAAYEVSEIINEALIEHPKEFKNGFYFFSTGPNHLYYQRNGKEQTLPWKIEKYFAAGVGHEVAQYLLSKLLDNKPKWHCADVSRKVLSVISECARYHSDIGGKLAYGVYAEKPCIIKNIERDPRAMYFEVIYED